MKSLLCVNTSPARAVAPHAGAWIEIHRLSQDKRNINVAPHAGAWIEIKMERKIAEVLTVAPHAGAWIEIGSHAQ